MIAAEGAFVKRLIIRPNPRLGEIPGALADAGPRRFIIEESSTAGELLPSGYSCQRWGTVIRHADGSVTLNPDPWEKRGTA
jgi:hypothetical protein